jgi:hypothetical protein
MLETTLIKYYVYSCNVRSPAYCTTSTRSARANPPFSAQKDIDQWRIANQNTSINANGYLFEGKASSRPPFKETNSSASTGRHYSNDTLYRLKKI